MKTRSDALPRLPTGHFANLPLANQLPAGLQPFWVRNRIQNWCARQIPKATSFSQ